VLVPSDRQIPISINDGVPIVMRDDRSEAARAFQKLAQTYVDQAQEHSASASAPASATAHEPVISERANKRRFAWRS
jgi:MinD-like ATPase involved in chromosome partitioning or flagellar assembly